MGKIDKEEIENFRKNLATFRKLAGWSLPEFAEMVDLSRQTITNIENKEYSMSCVQYIAFRSLFEREAELQQEVKNPVLQKSMAILLSNQRGNEESVEQMQTLAAAKAGGATTNQILSIMSIIIPVAVNAIATFAFIDSILNVDD